MEKQLKTIQPHFNNLVHNLKTFELRKDDRDYQVGDILHLQEYDPVKKVYSGREVVRTVSHVLRNAPEFGLMDGYCILSIK